MTKTKNGFVLEICMKKSQRDTLCSEVFRKLQGISSQFLNLNLVLGLGSRGRVRVRVRVRVRFRVRSV
jgi:hypothetical protein